MGSKVIGKVFSVQTFGVFIELDKEVFGLLKVPDFENSKIPLQYPKVGDSIHSYILHYEEGKEKVSLTQKPKL